ncbi:MAG: Bifunctional protein GlmU [Berkelbacteria bacterium GW2011_GWB1_38_5]|uniref:Bifunctional protein GlmU n=2 Tax=Candidatus Berkelbacteria TaxID=1618330 RepID=A0A0G0LGL7_9BACT|nr:MAG: Bifunctional protein GlmU [Berkelbacteria bacterium GW2011_GWB1_38_5]KKQ91033.1 MAG: Bifunctional protein GlmU [Berkelbacteria bacterium GW2011_GWA1_39_10]
MKQEKYAAIILVAGKGTRMNEGKASPIPKVMFEMLGKPIVWHSVKAIKGAGILKVVLVVGYKKELVENYMGKDVEYVVQEKQLGTGHATTQAASVLKGKTESIIVFYGDNPLYKTETIKKLIDLYEKERPTIAMLSVNFEDPEFWAFGRIIRNKKNEVIGITEQKDCTPEQLKIKESNPGFYIINADWFWENGKKIEKKNSQGEFYLTDIVEIACNQGKKILAIPVSDEEEALGINTPDQLKQAEKVLKKRNGNI